METLVTTALLFIKVSGEGDDVEVTVVAEKPLKYGHLKQEVRQPVRR